MTKQLLQKAVDNFPSTADLIYIQEHLSINSCYGMAGEEAFWEVERTLIGIIKLPINIWRWKTITLTMQNLLWILIIIPYKAIRSQLYIPVDMYRIARYREKLSMSKAVLKSLYVSIHYPLFFIERIFDRDATILSLEPD